MELPPYKPGKQERIRAALHAVEALDSVNKNCRATSDRYQKQEWLQQAYTHPQVADWAGPLHIPDIEYKFHPGGTWRIANGETAGQVVYHLGPRAMTDVQLALGFAYGARMAGWPTGSRLASGLVHDPSMLMLLVAGLFAHSPARAKEVHDLLTAMGLNIGAPAGSWDPGRWA